jgi:hypothetical protein
VKWSPSKHAGRVGVRVSRDILVEVLHIHLNTKPDLLDIAQTPSLARLLTRLCKHRKQDRRQYRDNRDNHQKLDQSESLTHGRYLHQD